MHAAATANHPVEATPVSHIQDSRPVSTGRLVLYFAGPIIGIVASTILFAIVSFVVNSSGSMQGGVFQTVSDTLVFLLGGVCVILIPVGIVLGTMGVSRNNRAAAGAQAVVKTAENTLEASKGWNWGAFLFTWIWGVANGVPKSLWALIPIWNIVYAFILGAKGNQWAWEGRDWTSVEDFRASQHKWAIWGLIIYGIIFVLYLIGAVSGNNNS